MTFARVRAIAWLVVATVVGHFVWPVFKGLGAAAVEDWVNRQIAMRFGIGSPTQEQAIAFIVSWTTPALLVLLIYFVFRFGHWRGQRLVLMRLEASDSSIETNKREVAPPKSPEPNLTASDAFFKILEDSEWAREQHIKTDTANLVQDWLERRLSKEIHNALRNARLNAWGEQCLHGMVTTPQKTIPLEVWDTVEIRFDADERFPRTAAYRKGRTTYEFGRQEWVDIKFSAEQIFSLFPIETSSEDWRMMYEGVAHVARCIGDLDNEKYWPAARLQIRQRALNKRIAIRGCKSAKLMAAGLSWSKVETEIPSQYWEGADITEVATVNEDDRRAPETFPHRFSDGLFGSSEIYLYTKLRVNWAEISKEWPDA